MEQIVIYPVADEIRQPTNNNIKPDCCRIHKDMKDGKHQLGSMYTLELKKAILQAFSAIYTSSPGMNMQSVFRYITWILTADHRALLSNLVFKCALFLECAHSVIRCLLNRQTGQT